MIKTSYNLIEEIKRWLTDFENRQPKDAEIDEDTFEGWAYYLLRNVLSEVEELETEKSAVDEAYNRWLYS